MSSKKQLIQCIQEIIGACIASDNFNGESVLSRTIRKILAEYYNEGQKSLEARSPLDKKG